MPSLCHLIGPKYKSVTEVLPCLLCKLSIHCVIYYGKSHDYDKYMFKREIVLAAMSGHLLFLGFRWIHALFYIIMHWTVILRYFHTFEMIYDMTGCWLYVNTNNDQENLVFCRPSWIYTMFHTSDLGRFLAHNFDIIEVQVCQVSKLLQFVPG